MDSYQTVAAKIKEAEFIAISTGAGISAESGIPTFRGKDGLWRKHKPESLATPQAFYADPELVWEFYDYRRNLVKSVEPNPAHYALVNIEENADKFCLITQNVDNLHFRAGSKNIIELHGNLAISRCTRCSYETKALPTPLEETLPTCPECGELLRPGVVWFGEQLPVDAINAAFRTAQQCDLMLVIGTSGLVQPAASLPHLAKREGAFVVEVNIEETPITAVADITLLGKAGEALNRIVDLI
jgi:NAD-dependent deacetylase